MIPFSVLYLVAYVLFLRQTIAMQEVFFSKCKLAMYVTDDNKHRSTFTRRFHCPDESIGDNDKVCLL